MDLELKRMPTTAEHWEEGVKALQKRVESYFKSNVETANRYPDEVVREKALVRQEAYRRVMVDIDTLLKEALQ